MIFNFWASDQGEATGLYGGIIKSQGSLFLELYCSVFLHIAALACRLFQYACAAVFSLMKSSNTRTCFSSFPVTDYKL